MFKTAAIIGTGLIGGSLGMALKKQRLAKTVLGVSRRSTSLAAARRYRAIDRGSRDLKSAADADLLILAAPVGQIIPLCRRLAKIIRPDCIVIDVGSTKGTIVGTAGSLFTRFVGCHPMTGSEKKGVQHARADLFAHSLCIITPAASTDRKALSAVEQLWKRLGARVTRMSARDHDLMVSMISHLPHCLAFSLMNSVPERFLRFAAGSFRDATRVAAADSTIWTDILLTNAAFIRSAARIFQNRLTEIIDCLERQDRRKLVSLLRRAQSRRIGLS